MLLTINGTTAEIDDYEPMPDADPLTNPNLARLVHRPPLSWYRFRGVEAGTITDPRTGRTMAVVADGPAYHNRLGWVVIGVSPENPDEPWSSPAVVGTGDS